MKSRVLFPVLLLFAVFCAWPALAAQPRVIGGEDAKDGDWPYVAALVKSHISDAFQGQFCGGTLVNHSWVVTAAHCVDDKTAGQVDIVVGRTNLSSDDGERIKVEEIVVHPRYDSHTEDNDIALLRLGAPASEEVAMVIRQDDPYGLVEQGVECEIIGWGATSNLGDYPHILQQAEVPIYDQDQAAFAYRSQGYALTENMLAAGPVSGLVDTCSGDSGGPLLAPDASGDGWVLAGITSWGLSCAEPDYPGIYTKVSQYTDWIESYTGSATDRLYFPHVDSGAEWKTEICVVNKDGSGNATGIIFAYKDDGTKMDDTYTLELAPRGRAQFLVADEFTSPADIGYMVLEYTGGEPVGYSKFYIQDQYRVAIPATDHITEGTIDIPHIDSSQFWWTGLSLVNTTSSSKNLTMYFDTGDKKSIALAPLEHKSFTVASLFNGQARPDIASARITSADGVIGLELFGSADQLSGVLLKDQTQRDTDMDYPHIAMTDGWWTGIVAYNPSTSSNTILYLTGYDQSGIKTAYLTRIIPPLGKLSTTARDLGLDSTTAWLHLHSTKKVCGFELFGTGIQNRLGGYSVFGISKKQGVFPKYSKTGEWTGIAFANPAAESTDITLEAIDGQGKTIATETIALGGRAKISAQPEDIFNADISEAAYITFKSGNEIAGFQLNGDNGETMLDALPAQ